MTATPDTSGSQTTLADVNSLRARRVTLHSNSDLDDFSAAARRIAEDIADHPGSPGRSIIGAVALAALVIIAAGVVAGLLFDAGAALMESLGNGS
ncbi:hypothetical protein [Corynebacterium sanguinis]|uniref:hypothetical protein n=1 Tax=Corynebacterium sanguinis TaxID=2594913 RepID=UPI0010AA007C|nr:hypothetical protein [Corynebacterium sanguinis]MCT1555152.1 hypothetical protein [Corynebacterium sanguinis]TVS28207.1 hypothetical protein EKI56_00025 [Corynebacterium sanguinis]